MADELYVIDVGDEEDPSAFDGRPPHSGVVAWPPQLFGRRGASVTPSLWDIDAEARPQGSDVERIAVVGGAGLGAVAFCVAITAFGLFVTTCFVAPFLLLFVYCYAWAQFFAYSRESCDVPFIPWLGVILGYTLLLMNRHPGVLMICGGTGTDRRSLRQAMFRAVIGFPFLWMWLGRFLVARSEYCVLTSPDLFRFIDWFSWYGTTGITIIATLYCCLGVLSFLGTKLLLWLYRRGHLGSLLAFSSRHGVLSVARNNINIDTIETVPFVRSSFADPSDSTDPRPACECCICLDAYDAQREIKRTRCGHYMHRDCLEVWLRAAYTCPTCRTDLEAGREETGVES